MTMGLAWIIFDSLYEIWQPNNPKLYAVIANVSHASTVNFIEKFPPLGKIIEFVRLQNFNPS